MTTSHDNTRGRDNKTAPVPTGDTPGGAITGPEPQGTRAEVSPRRPADPPWRGRVAHRWLPPHLAAALRQARVSRGWTLVQAARHIYVSEAALRHLEKGDRRPSAEMAEELIFGYGLDRVDRDTAAGLRAVAAPYAGRSSPFRTGEVPR